MYLFALPWKYRNSKYYLCILTVGVSLILSSPKHPSPSLGGPIQSNQVNFGSGPEYGGGGGGEISSTKFNFNLEISLYQVY